MLLGNIDEPLERSEVEGPNAPRRGRLAARRKLKGTHDTANRLQPIPPRLKHLPHESQPDRLVVANREELNTNTVVRDLTGFACELFE
jgi:hypothetical protein